MQTREISMSPAQTPRSLKKRQDIVDGAITAFQQFGVSDTSMDKIAETAQVSKRTVYNHFESKEVLVAEIIRDIWSQNVLTYDYQYNANKDLRSQLAELVSNELRFICDPNNLDLIRVAMGYCLFNPNMFDGDIREFFEQETTLIRWLRLAMEDGKLKKSDPHKLSEQLISLLKGQAFWPQLLHQDAPLTNEQLSELKDETLNIFLNYYAI